MKLPFEAVVLRYVHDLATEEFVNIGVLVFSPDADYAGAKFVPTLSRVTALFPDADLVHLRRVTNAIAAALETWTIRRRSELPLERETSLGQLLPKVVPTDDLGIRASRALSGISANPEQTLAELFERFVGRFIPQQEQVTRDDSDVWRGFIRLLPSQSLAHVLQPVKLHGAHFEYEFPHAWKNGIWNVAQPLSFDMIDATWIRDKALVWVGRMLALSIDPEETNVHFVVGSPSADRPKLIREASEDARSILSEELGGRVRVIDDDGAEARQLATKIAKDTQGKL